MEETNGRRMEMYRFVSINRGEINLDQVRRYQYQRDGLRVWWANGDDEVLPFDMNECIDTSGYHIIPAASGYELLMAWLDEPIVERTPVIAWRIEEDQTKARWGDGTIIAIGIEMTSADKPNNLRVGVRCPDGTMRHYADGRQWPNEAEWLKWCEGEKEQYQREEAVRKLHVVESKGA